jgi:diguanylate cyclase (GGDEF)-like protein
MPSLDASTLVLLTAFQLIATGGLGLLYSGKLRYRGTRLLAGFLALMGIAFIARMLTGPASIDRTTVAVDSIAVLAALLLVQGLRIFHGRRAIPAVGIGAMLGVYALLHLALIPRFGASPRVLLQSGVLGSIFLISGFILTVEARRHSGAARHPLALLAVLTISQGAAAWIRFAYVARFGADNLYAGPVAQVFYVYASITGTLVSLGMLWMVFARMYTELGELAARDSLTNSLNRHGLDHALWYHFGRREASALTLLQVDVDHFKRINDTWGHEVGDQVLRAVSDALHAGLRGGDFVARVGGEEFLVACAVAEASEALALAERLRARVESLRLPRSDGAPITCTVSIGVSGPIMSRALWQAGMRAADGALYQAKAAGRNCVRGVLVPALI